MFKRIFPVKQLQCASLCPLSLFSAAALIRNNVTSTSLLLLLLRCALSLSLTLFCCCGVSCCCAHSKWWLLKDFSTVASLPRNLVWVCEFEFCCCSWFKCCSAVGVVANCAASKLSHEIYFANTKFINFSAAALLCWRWLRCSALSVGWLLLLLLVLVLLNLWLITSEKGAIAM